jgi:protein-disulfide isomerase
MPNSLASPRSRTAPVTALLCCALLTAVVSPLPAQQAAAQKPSPQPAPTNQDIEAIKRQMQALIAAQIAVQKQLDEIKAMLKAGAGAPAPAAAPAPAPAIANVDFVIDIASAAVKGAPTARVAIIEFSDYECPFCARHALNTLPELAKEYIDTGKIRYVFRNLPLESIHPNAMRAAVAAECAGEQGKYWQLHDRMFANQRALDATSLVNHGKAEGLDVKRFQACLSSDKYTAKIRADQTESGRVGATSTPSFYVAVLTPGDSKARAVRMIRGAHPYPTFKAAIDSVLASIK